MLKCDDLALIEEISDQKVAVSASPGFTWGRSGNISNGTYLLNDTVPSNITGRRVPISSGIIATVFVDTEEISTFEIVIFKHPSPFTTLAVVPVVSSKGGTFILNDPLPQVFSGDVLGIQIINGSCKNPVIGLIIRGTI